jgi:hypothetical protein
MPDAGLGLELAIAQDLCRMRQPSCWGVWLPAQVYKWRRLAELGVIGVPGASELPSSRT